MNNNTSTISTILDGISKTLNIANKAVPLYKEAKPLLNNAKNVYTNIKNSKNDLGNMLKLMKLKNEMKNNTNIINGSETKKISTIENNTYSNINNPKFFI